MVILATLVLQGLSLKPLIKFLKIQDDKKDVEQLEAEELRLRLAESVLTYLDINYADKVQENETYKRVRDGYDRMIEVAKRKNNEQNEESFLSEYRQMLIELVNIRRRELMYMRYKGEFSEELIREREWELDLEEARLKK